MAVPGVMHDHLVRFHGPGLRSGASHYGPLLRALLDTLVDGCQQATRMLVEGRSSAPGTPPSWLENASSFEVRELRASELHLRTHALSERLSADMWGDQVHSGHTASGLGLLEDGLEHAIHGVADSERYDRRLIETLESFGRILQYNLEAIEIVNGRVLRIDDTSVRSIRELRARIPEDQRLSFTGVIEQINHDRRRFTLTTDSGDNIVVLAWSNDALTRVSDNPVGRSVMVTGVVRYRPSGQVLRVDAERVWEKDDVDAELQRMVEQGALRDARVLLHREISAGRGDAVAAWVKLLALPVVKTGAFASGREDFGKNQQWLDKHQRDYEGLWVALRDGERVDSDRSFKILQQRLRARIDNSSILVTKCGGTRGSKSGT